MDLRTILISILLSLIPISELRGGLPYALISGIPLLPAYLICVIANALVGPLVFLFLSSLHKLLDRWQPYRLFFDRIIDRSRKKVHDKVEKYGYAGLMLFVAIPLPVTGAYTDALGAWVLGMKKRKSLLVLAAGVIIAGIIVSAVYLIGITALYIFIK
ncbi:hypothetical protein ES703_72234 [subsurface metagenome]